MTATPKNAAKAFRLQREGVSGGSGSALASPRSLRSKVSSAMAAEWVWRANDRLSPLPRRSLPHASHTVLLFEESLALDLMMLRIRTTTPHGRDASTWLRGEPPGGLGRGFFFQKVTVIVWSRDKEKLCQTHTEDVLPVFGYVVFYRVSCKCQRTKCLTSRLIKDSFPIPQTMLISLAVLPQQGLNLPHFFHGPGNMVTVPESWSLCADYLHKQRPEVTFSLHFFFLAWFAVWVPDVSKKCFQFVRGPNRPSGLEIMVVKSALLGREGRANWH